MSADTRISTDAETQRGRAQIGRCNYSKARRYERLWFVVERQLMLVRSIIVI